MVKENNVNTVNSRYNFFGGPQKNKRYIKKKRKMLYQESILNVCLHIDMYGTQYIVC